MTDPKQTPYKNLGGHLKALRTKRNESLAEASGAVEIDVKQLASYELGHARPSEDVLLLLISHFGARDDEAVRLWEVAGYGMEGMSQPAIGSGNLPEIADESSQKILFTDVVDITVNNYGVVMNFMQGAGPNTKPSSIARVGMSREHAKSVLRILQMTINQTERNLPSPSPRQLNAENQSPDNKN